MSIRRRDFLKLGLSQSLALGMNQLPKLDSEKSQRRSLPSIVQGPTDENRTQFSVVHEHLADFLFIVEDSLGNLIECDRVTSFRPEGQKKAVTQVFVSSLRPYEDYSLLLKDPVTGVVVDRRFFRTLPDDSAPLKFAICSCMDDDFHEPLIWRDLLQKSPDVIFFIGDSTYADSELGGLLYADPATLWRRFCEARATLEIYFSQRLIPVFSVWDDHDFGGNDIDSTSYPFVRESQQNFLTFFPQDPTYCSFLERGPGIASAFRFRRHLIFLLDDRSFRQKKKSRDRYAHWGKDQEDWLMNLLADHDGSCWIMNGTQIFPALIFKESVSGDHPVQLSGFLSRLKQAGKKVIFASGDVHYSEISRVESARLGYETYEITSSSIHSRGFPGAPTILPNPRRIVATGKRNYILVESHAETGNFVVESRSARNELNFRRQFKI